MSPDWRILARGAMAGAAVFTLIGVAGDRLAGGLARGALLTAAAVLAGVASSVAAGRYVSGTSLCAGALGLLAVWALGGRDVSADALATARESLAGTMLLLITYVAAWQADVRWTLPSAHERKVVGGRELAFRNVPALVVCAALALAVSRLAAHALSGGLAFLGWAAACVVGGAAAAAWFAPRSTFFIWTAPVAGLLAGGAAVGGVWPGVAHVPPACLAPLGALAAVAGRRLARSPMRALG